MSIAKNLKDRRSHGGCSALYTCAGVISMENCVTAVTDNLIVNLVPTSSSSSSGSSASSGGGASSSSSSGSLSKKRNDQSYQDEGNNGNNRVLVGVTHLDTFLIHEVVPNGGGNPGAGPNVGGVTKEFSTKHVNSVQLPSSLQNRCVVFRSKWISVCPTSVCTNGGNKNSYGGGASPVPVKLLILCTNLATYFYNEMGTKQLYKFSCEVEGEGGGSNNDNEDCDSLGGSSRTIAATKEKILLGNERGEIYLLTYQPKEKKGGGGNIVHATTLKVSPEPVAELCARRSGLVAVGTSSGNLSIWTGFEGSQPLKSTEYLLSKPEPVTGIVLWYPYAIVSYGSGIIRMFNLVQKVLSAQVFAHARWISTLDLCPGSNLLLSISEDDEARIWSLRRRQKGEQRSPIKLHSSIPIEDVNLIGGKFLNGDGTLIALSNLGSKDIALYAALSSSSSSSSSSSNT